MDPPQTQDIPTWLPAAAGLAAWTSICLTTFALLRWRKGLPVVPFKPRRRVPWGGLHLLIVLLTYVGLMFTMGVVAGVLLPERFTKPPAASHAGEPDMNHLVVRLLQQADWWVLFVCGFTAVVVAPIVEEFFFRVLLQGWLEAAQRRLRHRIPALLRLLPGASGPILLTAALFAGMHFRWGSSPISVEFATLMLAIDGAVKILTAMIAVVLVTNTARATAADLGWSRETFLPDVGLGLITFAAVAAPLYALMAVLGAILPKDLAPDPFVLFPFALVLGILYYRTHRLATAVALHMALNATSLALALWTLNATQ